MESVSVELKVMPTIFRGYSYLFAIHWNHSRFLITDALKSRNVSEVMKTIFQNLICAHSTNIKEIYCDLDTAFKNEVMNTLLNSVLKLCFVVYNLTK